MRGQPGREGLDYLLPVFRAFAALDGLHDFAPDQPIGEHHVGVDGADDIISRLLQNGCDAVEQTVARHWRCRLGNGGAFFVFVHDIVYNVFP